ncbi:MAG TPA: hypothetical protein DCS23_00360 [Candidatus Yonathbacteria bacterium]|nr:hypothetical protein [Candidatus Yonathbacteria bacterium]
MSNTISLSKTEYVDLTSRAKAYDMIVSLVQKEVSFVPPVRSTKKIISELKKTERYSQDFLKSVEKGFKRSTHFTK